MPYTYDETIIANQIKAGAKKFNDTYKGGRRHIEKLDETITTNNCIQLKYVNIIDPPSICKTPKEKEKFGIDVENYLKTTYRLDQNILLIDANNNWTKKIIRQKDKTNYYIIDPQIAEKKTGSVLLIRTTAVNLCVKLGLRNDEPIKSKKRRSSTNNPPNKRPKNNNPQQVSSNLFDSNTNENTQNGIENLLTALREESLSTSRILSTLNLDLNISNNDDLPANDIEKKDSSSESDEEIKTLKTEFRKLEEKEDGLSKEMAQENQKVSTFKETYRDFFVRKINEKQASISKLETELNMTKVKNEKYEKKIKKISETEKISNNDEKDAPLNNI